MSKQNDNSRKPKFYIISFGNCSCKKQGNTKRCKSIELEGHDEKNSLNKLNFISFKINKK